MNKGEAYFGQVLVKSAPLFKCDVTIIPDEKITASQYRAIKKARSMGQHVRVNAYRRPFDAVLTTSTGAFYLELKYNNGQQKEHQKATELMINSINPIYYVIKKIEKLSGKQFISRYKIIQRVPTKDGVKKTVIEVNGIEEIFEYFKNIKK